MATEFRESTLNGAGMALRELVKHGNALEAQISIALMLAYLGDMYEVENQEMAHVMLHNMEQLRQDPGLKARVYETLHNLATRDHKLIVRSDDEDVGAVHKVGDLKRHNMLPQGGIIKTPGGIH